MKPSERIDKLEEKLNSIDKRLTILIVVLFLILPIGASNGALIKGLVTGMAVTDIKNTEVGNTMVDTIIVFAIAAGLGSALRAYMGYVNKKQEGIAWNWKMFLASFLPAVGSALAGTAFLDLVPNASNFILVFIGAAGVNSIQDKLGLQITPKKK